MKLAIKRNKATGFAWTKVSIPIFEVDFYVIFGPRHLEMFNAFTKFILNEGYDKSLTREDGFDNLSYAMTGMLHEDGNIDMPTPYVYFCENLNEDKDLDNTIIHEAYHLTGCVFYLTGMQQFNTDNNEHFAYLIGWLGRNLMLAVNALTELQETEEKKTKAKDNDRHTKKTGKKAK